MGKNILIYIQFSIKDFYSTLFRILKDTVKSKRESKNYQ